MNRPRTSQQRPLRIGLTGGIGSGKSTVAQILQNRGAAVIDADAISRTLTAAKGAAIPSITRTFGVEFINQDGSLNREYMRNHVFGAPQAKIKLEAIIHPLVMQEAALQAQKAIAQGHLFLIFDVPLMVESGYKWRRLLDRILLVDCEPETQIQRVIERSGLSREIITSIMSTQASRNQKLNAADWVIFNNGITLEILTKQVTELPI